MTKADEFDGGKSATRATRIPDTHAQTGRLIEMSILFGLVLHTFSLFLDARETKQFEMKIKSNALEALSIQREASLHID